MALLCASLAAAFDAALVAVPKRSSTLLPRARLLALSRPGRSPASAELLFLRYDAQRAWPARARMRPASWPAAGPVALICLRRGLRGGFRPCAAVAAAPWGQTLGSHPSGGRKASSATRVLLSLRWVPVLAVQPCLAPGCLCTVHLSRVLCVLTGGRAVSS
jgi:hypothetical protein